MDGVLCEECLKCAAFVLYLLPCIYTPSHLCAQFLKHTIHTLLFVVRRPTIAFISRALCEKHFHVSAVETTGSPAALDGADRRGYGFIEQYGIHLGDVKSFFCDGSRHKNVECAYSEFIKHGFLLLL